MARERVPVAVKVDGLKELRAALKAAEGRNPRELTRSLKVAGEPVPPLMRAKAPVRTGELKASIGNVSARGTTARIPATANHAVFAEFQKKGRYGTTMSGKWGPPPRFGYRAIDELVDVIAARLEQELEPIYGVYGWGKIHGR